MDGENVQSRFEKIHDDVHSMFYDNFSLFGLKAFIVLWALFVIVLAMRINNKWLLAGIIAYEVLP